MFLFFVGFRFLCSLLDFVLNYEPDAWNQLQYYGFEK